MDQQKGFTLIEVLSALLLVTALSFSLIQQQMQSRYLLNQVIARIHQNMLCDFKAEKQLSKNEKPNWC